jgi:hypothetical protein
VVGAGTVRVSGTRSSYVAYACLRQPPRLAGLALNARRGADVDERADFPVAVRLTLLPGVAREHGLEVGDGRETQG